LYVLKRQAGATGAPRRMGDTGGLAARHDVELLEADIAGKRGGGEVNQLSPDAWIEDELPAIDIDGACPAGGEDERLVLEEQHRLDLEQHPGRDLGGERLVGEVHARRGF